MPQNFVQLTYPFPYKNTSGDIGGTSGTANFTSGVFTGTVTANALIVTTSGSATQWVGVGSSNTKLQTTQTNNITVGGTIAEAGFGAINDVASYMDFDIKNSTNSANPDTGIIRGKSSGGIIIDNIGSGSTTDLRAAGVSTLKITSGGVVVPSLTPSSVVLTDSVRTLTSVTVLGLANGGTGNTTGAATVNANLTGGVTSVGNAATVVTNANLTGDVTSVGNATTYNNALPIAKGGTGATTTTGTGSSVLSISPTFTGTVGAANLTATGTVTANSFAVNAIFSASVGQDTRCYQVSANGFTLISAGAIALGTRIFVYGTAMWNFNMPTTAGTAGQFLTTQGGGSTAMTWTGGGAPVRHLYTISNASISLDAGALYYKIDMIASGGGSGGSGTTIPTGGTAGNSTLTATVGQTGVVTCFGGLLSSSNTGPSGGALPTTTLTGIVGAASASPGAPGMSASSYLPNTYIVGGQGGESLITGGYIGGTVNAAGVAPNSAYYGAGASGAGTGATTTTYGSAGAGSGSYTSFIMTGPTTVFAYVQGAVGTAGAAGTSGFAGAAGAAGCLVITSYYQ